MTHSRPTRWGDYSRRLIASFCAALVFALGLFAASPALHRQLHPHGHLPADDGCAVTLFASGVSSPVPMIALTPPAAEWQEVAFVRTADVFVSSPHYRFQPGRGPPAA